MRQTAYRTVRTNKLLQTLRKRAIGPEQQAPASRHMNGSRQVVTRDMLFRALKGQH